MNRLVSHIEFLLHDHNCVIIPGFGGFVVNAIPPRRDGIATFHAPSCELVFNRDLSHNDGLLAQSYMKNGNMTFELAMEQVEQDVQELKRRLHEHLQVDMGSLGIFNMYDDKRFVYTPGTFVRPSFFGLTQATLKPLIQIQPVVAVRENEAVRNWRRSVGVTAAAVAAIAVLMIILPVSDTNIRRQSARIISETEWFRPKVVQPANNVTVVKANKTADAKRVEELSVSSTPTDATLPIVDVIEANAELNAPKYYIVMGVFKGVESAEKTTKLLLDEGFHQTGWLKRSDRIDVYAASFTDKNAADVYLKEVHKKFPRHTDAWILKR
ncbi:hypothetical protein [Proteiniphilum sp. UBA5384]|uniref:HU domain-containing protein n=1 Tax=Proteiniphilum sp. UBA5384 TaxID=1947279 RepID=UPI0025D43E18|nr:hypothetical protein [Proteiniphilum sp. UBA5384]